MTLAVRHAKLIGILQRMIKDDAVISLIHKYLNAGVMVNGKYEETREGMPQGSPPSPLLANELDKELERRGHPFVRHADDGLIFCKGRRGRGDAGAFAENLAADGRTERRNSAKKTESAYVGKLKFLGYGFYIRNGKCRLRMHQKTEAKMRRRLKAITSRSTAWGTPSARPRSENICGGGWTEYYKLADMGSKVKETDQWLRRRIRMCIWKVWKRPGTRVRNLIKCGIPK